jgi:hypothetical protein
MLDEEEPVCTMGAFKVDKKNSLARLIINATNINAAQGDPLPILLDSIHHIATAIAESEMVMTVDALSYFYQFRLHPGVARFFGLNVNNSRGRASRRAFNRLPMGWKFAPAIAQRTSRFLLALLKRRLAHLSFAAHVWLDNFIFGCKTGDAEIIMSTFKQICQEFNVALHKEEYHKEFLGLQKQGNAVFLSQKLIEKWSVAISRLSAPHSVRVAAQALGYAFYAGFLTNVATGHLSHLARRLAATVDLYGWEGGLAMNEELRQSLEAFVEQVRAKEIRVVPFDEVLAADIFSDASLAGWAFSSIDEEGEPVVFHGLFYDQNERIFLRELRTALMALLNSARLHRFVRLHVDNTAVMFCLRSQRSPNATANEWIRRVLEVLPASFAYQVWYVHTSRNPVDKYTRPLWLQG